MQFQGQTDKLQGQCYRAPLLSLKTPAKEAPHEFTITMLIPVTLSTLSKPNALPFTAVKYKSVKIRVDVFSTVRTLIN